VAEGVETPSEERLRFQNIGGQEPDPNADEGGAPPTTLE